MTVGLRIRDRTTGVIKLEITDRLTRVLGQIVVAGTNGSLTNPGFSMGTFWYAMLDYADGAIMQGQTPEVSCNPATGVMSWAYTGNAAMQKYTVKITYGIY